jgi:polyisoprenoid-binding protein YceI
MKLFQLLGFISFILPNFVFAEVETYRIDHENSFATWQIRHVVAKAGGTFSDVTGKIILDKTHLANSKIEATINVFSLDSDHRERDAHLLSSDFLDANKFNKMQFVSTSIEPSSPQGGILKGDLTLHGVTQPVRLSFKILGSGEDARRWYRTGFEAQTMIKRSDYGINLGLDTPDGGPIGDQIDITLLIEGIKLTREGNIWQAPAKITPPAPPEPSTVEPAASESLDEN